MKNIPFANNFSDLAMKLLKFINSWETFNFFFTRNVTFVESYKHDMIEQLV